MQRFFVDFPLSIDLILRDAAIVHQLTRVLRAQVWESITLFDGDGSESIYQITGIDKKSITLRGMGRSFPDTEAKKSIILYQALPNKIEKIEYILQKWVEIGIRWFVFFRSERSQKLTISDAKQERWTHIIREAVEQCGGVCIPTLDILDKASVFSHAERIQDHIVLDTTWVLHRTSDYRDFQDVGVWVWPEWGWSDDERSKMDEYGFIFARFWERVMRTETAGWMIAFSLLNQ